MGAPTTGRVALLAIHPEYAGAILRGHKTVEFRKRPLAADVTTVVLYATAPVSRIVGKFRVADIVLATPARLWRRHHDTGAIAQEAFDRYYCDTEAGAAILVQDATSYGREVALAELTPSPAIPQSFTYLDESILEQLDSLQASAAWERVEALGSVERTGTVISQR